MRFLFLTLLCCYSATAFAQDVEYKSETNEVFVDGSFAFKIVQEDCGLSSTDCHYDVFDKTDKKVLRVNMHGTYDPANPRQPRAAFCEFIFLEARTKAEVAWPGIKPIKVARIIAKNKIMSKGNIDNTAVDEFVLSNGTRFSDRR